MAELEAGLICMTKGEMGVLSRTAARRSPDVEPGKGRNRVAWVAIEETPAGFTVTATGTRHFDNKWQDIPMRAVRFSKEQGFTVAIAGFLQGREAVFSYQNRDGGLEFAWLRTEPAPIPKTGFTDLREKMGW